jgi:cell division protein FtsZ
MPKELKKKNITSIINEEQQENVKVIGLGNAGIKIINHLNEMQHSPWLELAATDTDKKTLESSQIKNKFLIAEEWTHGQGCGGNLIKGERALAHKSSITVKNFIKESSLLIIIAGFGRGTGTGGAPIIARFAKELNIPVIILATLPFTFEGHSKREIAERQINTLIKTTNTVIPIPNDLLYTQLPPTASFEEAFKLSNTQVAKAILGISELLQFDNMLAVDLCALHNILCQQKTECAVGVGICESENMVTRTRDALKDLFDSPLLGGRERIRESDAVIISITGGNNLTIGEVKHTLDTLTSIAGNRVEIIPGANSDPSFGNKIQITVIPIKSDKSLESALAKEPPIHIAKQASKTAIIRNLKKLKDEAIQLELPFKNKSRGIFTNSTPTIYKGEDLDIPTFQREDIHLDKGK